MSLISGWLEELYVCGFLVLASAIVSALITRHCVGGNAQSMANLEKERQNSKRE